MDGACRFPLDAILPFGVGAIIDHEVAEGDVACDEVIPVRLSELAEGLERGLANSDFALSKGMECLGYPSRE